MSQPSEQPVRGIIRSLVEHHQHRNNNHPDKLNEAKESTRRDDGANMLNGIPANRKLVASFPADNDVFCAGEVLSRGDQCAMEVGIVVDHSSDPKSRRRPYGERGLVVALRIAVARQGLSPRRRGRRTKSAIDTGGKVLLAQAPCTIQHEEPGGGNPMLPRAILRPDHWYIFVFCRWAIILYESEIDGYLAPDIIMSSPSPPPSSPPLPQL
ncbi:uncharacterized protein BDCG_17732 [Blastomyces dermatitidis ER-3]|uniref:Uncharacterized protein n=1 Tax=Ajellomyces dermatitidis (strain ER-3 / ATCC MYA-2586) TaxID=559297 RepID=A0ABX2VZZ2_AJEDR|nr:uncharacterized protein BDCG_17732 [Blastomyces dermatitidis ER-3]OAT02702.1 hypothetical protein BDCG_17732 [Blastomyces dermatitidis ER-3]